MRVLLRGKLTVVPGADGLDQLVCKLVALDVNDILIREILFELVT